MGCVLADDQEQRSVTALFRLATRQLDISAIGVFSCSGPDSRLWAASDAFLTIWPGCGDRPDGENFPTPPHVGEALERTEVAKLDSGAFGLENGFAACSPVRHNGVLIGYILFLDLRRRWLGPRAAQGIHDVAELFAALLVNVTPGPAQRLAAAAVDTAGPAGSPGLSHITAHHDAHLMIRRARADPGATNPVALMLLDIDRFHAINEALGSAAGDEVIAAIVARLEAHLGDDDRIARIEADRFLILSTRLSESLPQFAASLLVLVNESVRIADQPVSVQATIGLVAPGSANTSAPVLFLQAESALRRGKLAGGNRIVTHEPAIEALDQEQSRLEIELGEAVASGQLRLAYQPYIDLRTNRIAGAEALLRWDHPHRGNIQPASFINLAETSGQILGIGAWALGRALKEAVDWSGDLNLSVNISALQFHQADFVSQVDRALAQSGFPAQRLELEITETVLLRNDPETIGQIRTLIARGVRIALDDFGTGYSALAYLARIPHHRIKLDRNFINDLTSRHTRDLVSAIVRSARTQGLAITAEGVETAEQLQAVRDLDFTHAQGWAISQPLDNPAILTGARALEITA